MGKLNLTISAKREGYSISQAGSTMTVGELVEVLNRYSDDTPVYISNDNGFTYGTIKEHFIHEKFESDEEEWEDGEEEEE